MYQDLEAQVAIVTVDQELSYALHEKTHSTAEFSRSPVRHLNDLNIKYQCGVYFVTRLIKNLLLKHIPI